MSRYMIRTSLIQRNKALVKIWIRTLTLSILVPVLCCLLLIGISFSGKNLKSINPFIKGSSLRISDYDVGTHRVVKRQFDLEEGGNNGRRFDPIPISRVSIPEEERDDVITGSGVDAPGSFHGLNPHLPYVNHSALQKFFPHINPAALQMFARGNNNSRFHTPQNDSNSAPRSTQPPTVYPTTRTEPFTFPTEVSIFALDSFLVEGGVSGRPTYTNTNPTDGNALSYPTVSTSLSDTTSSPKTTFAASTEVVSARLEKTSATLRISTPVVEFSSTLVLSSSTTKRSETSTSQPTSSTIRTTGSHVAFITAQDENETNIPGTKPSNLETSNQPQIPTNQPDTINQVHSTTNKAETVANNPVASQLNTIPTKIETTTRRPVSVSKPPEDTTTNRQPPTSVVEPSPPLSDYSTAFQSSQTAEVTSSNLPSDKLTEDRSHQLRRQLALAIVLPIVLMSFVVSAALAWVFAFKPSWDRNRRVGIVNQPVANGNNHHHRTPGSGSSDISSRESMKHNGDEIRNEAWPENGRMVTPNPV